MTIAGFAVGAERGFVYVRGEYPLGRGAHAQRAIDQARERGLLGPDVMGAGFAFDIEIRRGGGAYIAGEETALFASIEGNRPEPRNKPPVPGRGSACSGGRRSINNVETLVNVPGLDPPDGGVGVRGARAPRRRPGHKLFSVSGHVARPGVYEAPFGITLRRADRRSRAASRAGARSRPSTSAARRASSWGPTRCPCRSRSRTRARRARRSARARCGVRRDDRPRWTSSGASPAFFRDESCGQCVPCRVGTVRQEELLARLAARAADAGRSRTSSRCSRTSARSCGTPRSAAWARPRTTRCGTGLPARGGARDERGAERARTRASTRSSSRPRRRARRSCPSRRRPPSRRTVGLTIDGAPVTVAAGLDDPARPAAPQGIDIPTLCYGETVDPRGRLPRVRRGHRGAGPRAVLLREGRRGHGVETGQREGPPLAPARPRAAGLVGRRGPRRARAPGRIDRGADMERVRGRSLAVRPARAARPRPATRDAREAGHHHAPRRAAAETVAPARRRWTTSLFVRDYARCILCYKCVEACGVDAQNTFAIAVAGRGFDARVSTEYDTPLDTSACVFCGNCINVCPTGALMFRSEFEMRGGGHLGRVAPARSSTRSARTAAWAARSRSTSRTTGS